jgi:hypothetical protein
MVPCKIAFIWFPLTRSPSLTVLEFDFLGYFGLGWQREADLSMSVTGSVAVRAEGMNPVARAEARACRYAMSPSRIAFATAAIRHVTRIFVMIPSMR